MLKADDLALQHSIWWLLLISKHTQMFPLVQWQNWNIYTWERKFTCLTRVHLYYVWLIAENCISLTQHPGNRFNLVWGWFCVYCKAIITANGTGSSPSISCVLDFDDHTLASYSLFINDSAQHHKAFGIREYLQHNIIDTLPYYPIIMVCYSPDPN